MAAFCLSSVKWLVTRASTPPGFRASTDLAKKIVVQRKLLAVVVELHVGEGDVADHGVEGSGSLVSRKFSMRMSWPGCSAWAMRPEMRIQLDADEPHRRRGHGS